MQFANPKSDIAFKKIFGDKNKKNILISFLNAVIRLEGADQIKEVTILDPYQAPKIEGFKETILDINAKDKKGRTFIVEMQVEKQEYIGKRALYYTSKAYVNQIKKAEHYMELKSVIFIGILDFTIFSNSNYLSNHLLLNTDTGKQDIKDMEFNFIELPKFKKELNELENIIDKWIYFLKNAEDLEMVPQELKEVTEIEEALDIANRYQWSSQDIRIYEYWQMKDTGHLDALNVAKKEGKEEGREECWRKLQGYVYGKAIEEAPSFEGTLECIKLWKAQGHHFVVVSHKNQFPLVGPPYDMQQAALNWLERLGFFDAGIERDRVFFEPTMDKKVLRIANLQCDLFCDDLPEVLLHKDMPLNCRTIFIDTETESLAPSEGVDYRGSWTDLLEIFHGNNTDLYRPLIKKAGIREGAKFERLGEGRNNRVFKIHAEPSVILKHYFSDDRQRRFKESTFLQDMERQGIETTPRILSEDSFLNASLHTEVPGKIFPKTPPTRAHLQQALDFIDEINKDPNPALPLATEGCNCLEDHLTGLANRFQKLISSEIDPAVAKFIQENVLPIYETVSSKFSKAFSQQALQEPLGRSQQCISPSDFGFHNCLTHEDRCYFVDFEYAGWDDPAKLACDFVLQPSRPILEQDREWCWEQIAKLSGDSTACLERIHAVFPIHQLKWIAIILNEFLPKGQASRTFSSRTSKKGQLELAIQRLENCKHYLTTWSPNEILAS